jgi:hypothetical protein
MIITNMGASLQGLLIMLHMLLDVNAKLAVVLSTMLDREKISGSI